MLKKIGIGFAVLLVAIQFIRPSKNSGDNSKITTELLKTDAATLAIMDKACFDCHSANTRYLWYANIMPVGWLISHDINEGREHLDFSRWADYSPKAREHKLEEIIEMMEEGEMPLAIYLPTHPEAKLTEAEVNKIMDWAKSQW